MTEIDSAASRFGTLPAIPPGVVASGANLLAGSSLSLDAFAEVFARGPEPIDSASSSSPRPIEDSHREIDEAKPSDDPERVDEEPEGEEAAAAAVVPDKDPARATDSSQPVEESALVPEGGGAEQRDGDSATGGDSDSGRPTGDAEASAVPEDARATDGDAVALETLGSLDSGAGEATDPIALTTEVVRPETKRSQEVAASEATVAIPVNRGDSASEAGAGDSASVVEAADDGVAAASETTSGDSGEGDQGRQESGNRERFGTPGEGRFSLGVGTGSGPSSSQQVADSILDSAGQSQASAASPENGSADGVAESGASVSVSRGAAVSSADPTTPALPAAPVAASTPVAQRSAVTPTDSTGGGTQDAGQIGTEMRLSGASESRAKASGESTSVSDLANRVKLLQRVSRAFQHAGPEGGNIRIRLAPDELGTVRIEMQVQDKQVRARVVAETEAASHVLRENMNELKNRLESQGMSIDRIDVETDTGESGFGRFGGGRDSDGNYSKGASARNPRPSNEEQASSASGETEAGGSDVRGPIRAVSSDGRVDLVL